MFRSSHPLAWTFHGNTAGVHGILPADERVHLPAPPKEYPSAPLLALPAPRLPPVLLEQAMRERISCRRFSASPLGLEELATLLHAAYGIRSRSQLGGLELLERPVPSAGGLYPLELYVLVREVEAQPRGVHHYNPVLHGLEQVSATPISREAVTALFAGQPHAGGAGAVVVVTAVVERSLDKYGDRGYRYLLLEAGHVAQNLNLAVAALRLGACDLGAFADHDVAELLGVDLEAEIPLYGIAIGRPEAPGAGGQGDRRDPSGPPAGELLQ
jgi:SagB-type dehydrogenase family enzyme